MAIEEITNRPPYVMWEMRPIEDREASIKAGHIVEKDVAFAVITRPGSRDTLEKQALVWLGELQKNKELPAMWYTAFKDSYDRWVKGETGDVVGTPIKGWSMLGRGAQNTLIAAGILSVEDLAAVPEQDLQNIGTGALSFKMKAKAWLEASNGPGKMAEKAAAQDIQIAELKKLAETQAKAIDELKKQLPAKA